MFSRKHLLCGLAGLALCALLAPADHRGKPHGKPGGGGGDPPPAGTIYFNADGGEWTMDSDGANKAPLPANVTGEPSHELHGGHRWFLQWRLAGSGFGLQLFAVRGDGDEGFTVQLTTDPDLRKALNGWARWSKDDSAVSWQARRLASGTVVDHGIYVADILFDVDGNVVGLDAQPFAPAIGLHVPELGTEGDHDWAPDGTRIAYVFAGGSAPDELRVADLAGGGSTFLAEGDQPAWSPDGATIAFQKSDGLYTILPGGGGETRIVSNGKANGPNAMFVAWPRWSPTSSHIVYHRAPRDITNTDPGEIWRATAAGKDKVNLTADFEPDASPMAWR